MVQKRDHLHFSSSTSLSSWKKLCRIRILHEALRNLLQRGSRWLLEEEVKTTAKTPHENVKTPLRKGKNLETGRLWRQLVISDSMYVNHETFIKGGYKIRTMDKKLKVLPHSKYPMSSVKRNPVQGITEAQLPKIQTSRTWKSSSSRWTASILQWVYLKYHQKYTLKILRIIML